MNSYNSTQSKQNSFCDFDFDSKSGQKFSCDSSFNFDSGQKFFFSISIPGKIFFAATISIQDPYSEIIVMIPGIISILQFYSIALQYSVACFAKQKHKVNI